MTTNDKLVGVLNDLIQINNDRINGYEKAIEEIKDKDVDLQGIFSSMANDSRKYSAELSREVIRLGGNPDTGTTESGKLYRVWMDVKALFTGKDRQAILESCEFGEDAAQKRRSVSPRRLQRSAGARRRAQSACSSWASIS